MTTPVPAPHFRSERVSVVNGQFFFTTREGTLEGPFFSREEPSHRSIATSSGCRPLRA